MTALPPFVAKGGSAAGAAIRAAANPKVSNTRSPPSAGQGQTGQSATQLSFKAPSSKMSQSTTASST